MADSQHSHISWNDAVLWGLSIKKYIDVTHEGYTAAQKALLQIAVMYLLPSWQPDTTYPEGSIVRVAGKVYKALRETSESPVAFITDGNGNVLTTDSPWQMLIDHDVNDGNWAQLDLDYLISAASLPEQVEMALGLIREWDSKISADYIQWKADKEAELEAQYAKRLKDATDAANRANEAAAKAQAALDKANAYFDEFARATFLIDNYKSQ